MSMELFVLSNQALESIDRWQQAIDECGYSLKLSDGVPFAEQKGFLPALLNGENTGFECDHWPILDVFETYRIDSFPQWTNALAFRMLGSKIKEIAAAYFAASAYAIATDGAVFDCQEGKIISTQRAAEIAREMEAAGPRLAEISRRMQSKS